MISWAYPEERGYWGSRPSPGKHKCYRFLTLANSEDPGEMPYQTIRLD